MSEASYLPMRLAAWNPALSVWETGQMQFLCEHSVPYLETWPTSGMTRNGVAYELPTPELRTGGSGYSSSLLKTPTSQLAINGGSQHPDKRKEGGHGPTLADEVEHLLPTPAAMNPNDGEGLESWEARRQRVKLTAKNGNGFGTPLAIAVQLLPGATISPRSAGGKP